jgi:hypothetical protein
MRVLVTISAICISLIPIAAAQTTEVSAKPLTDAEIQLARSNVQADKNDIVAHTMQFTAAESSAFWPVYSEYTRDQQAIGNDRVQLIKDYAHNYDSIDAAKAKDMVQRMINIDNRVAQLRDSYWPKFEKALGAKRAAKFYQVDNRLTMLVNLQLASEIPLIP